MNNAWPFPGLMVILIIVAGFSTEFISLGESLIPH